jgi:hypothetical protein
MCPRSNRWLELGLGIDLRILISPIRPRELSVQSGHGSDGQDHGVERLRSCEQWQ